MKLNKQYCRDIKDVHFFDLESPSITLPKLSGLIVMDEIQRRPDLFVYLRFLVNNSDLKTPYSWERIPSIGTIQQ